MDLTCMYRHAGTAETAENSFCRVRPVDARNRRPKPSDNSNLFYAVYRFFYSQKSLLEFVEDEIETF